MSCDFAIYEPGPPSHNPHCHIMLTMRAINENRKWLLRATKFMTLMRTESVSSCHSADGKATRRIPLIGTSSTMSRNGDMAGSLFKISIWNLLEVPNEWIFVPMSGRGLMFFPPSIWELPFLHWNTRALKPTLPISTEILKPPTV